MKRKPYFLWCPRTCGENLYETIMCVIEEWLQIHDTKQRIKFSKIYRIGKLSSRVIQSQTK